VVAAFVKKMLPPQERPKVEIVEDDGVWDFRKLKGYGVSDSEDMRRILALPRRPRPPDAFLQEVADYLKQELGCPDGCPCRDGFNRPKRGCRCKEFGRRCCDNLLLTQAWALYEGAEYGGLLGPIGVGHGKTLLDMLMPMVLEKAKTVALLLMSGLKKQFLDPERGEWLYYSQHWHLPNLAGVDPYWPGRPYLHVLAFSELSGAKNTEVLEQLHPDAVIVDEAHNLRNSTAARTKRFKRVFKIWPETQLYCWSGTLTSKSIQDYAELSKFSLGEGSPVPLHWPTVEEWASALDPSEFPTPPGNILKLCEKGEKPRDGLRRRIADTAGVVSSGDVASCQASLYINEREVEVPSVVKKALFAFDEKAKEEAWQRPDGEELVDALSAARCARELSCGFYYRWRFPLLKGVAQKVADIEAWKEARKNWNKELREKLKKGGKHMDSPMLVTKAAIRWHKGFTHVVHDEDDNVLSRVEYPPHTPSKKAPEKSPTWNSVHWEKWEKIRDSVVYETEAVWLSDFLVDDALRWLGEGAGILWYEFNAFASRILEKGRSAGLTYAGPGDAGTDVVLGLRGHERVVASIRAHGTGRNLQCFARNLVSNPPSGGDAWEQLLGRTHRQGQEADEVVADVYRHTEAFRNAVETARELSDHIQGTFGSTQRLASVAKWNLKKYD
jgi:hypothetical protein